MKKTIALFVACALAYTLNAQVTTTSLLFNRAQFQPSKSATQEKLLTVPMIYKGTLTYKAQFQTNGAGADQNTNCIVSNQGNKVIYMTMCQPCIDCYPCQTVEYNKSDVPLTMEKWGPAAVADGTAKGAGEYITKWNLYYIDTHSNGNVEVFKIDLGANEGAVFYTGSNRAGSMFTANNGIWFTGNRNNYTFIYQDAKFDGTNWSDVKTAKQVAYIKSMANITGTNEMVLANVADDSVPPVVYPKAKITATYRLTRNSSLTNAAVRAVFSASVTSTGYGWEDCSVSSPASFCEAYFVADTLDTDNDMFDAYLLSSLRSNQHLQEGFEANPHTIENAFRDFLF